MLSKSKSIAEKIAEKYFTPYKPSVFDRGPAARLPEEYRKFWKEWRETVPEPVHFKPKEGSWINENGEMKRIENIPLPGFYTQGLNEVITGGEMIIQGFKKKNRTACRNPHFWVPSLRRSVIYSEVLNKYISVLITKRAINLIHEHQGFDNYVLKTRACDLGTKVALKLKRKILLSLRDKDLPYDDEKNEVIYNKYKEYLLPDEEVEWYGLSLTEAVKQLEEKECEKKLRETVPLKYIYRKNLIDKLKSGKEKVENVG